METIWGIIVLISLLLDDVTCARRGGYYSSYRSYTYYSRGGSTDPTAGIIVGAVIGGLCLVGGIIFLICLIKFCNKKKGTVVANSHHGTGNSTMVSSVQQQQPNGAWPQPAYPPPPVYTYGQPGENYPPPPAYPPPSS